MPLHVKHDVFLKRGCETLLTLSNIARKLFKLFIVTPSLSDASSVFRCVRWVETFFHDLLLALHSSKKEQMLLSDLNIPDSFDDTLSVKFLDTPLYDAVNQLPLVQLGGLSSKVHVKSGSHSVIVETLVSNPATHKYISCAPTT